jgi:hypothetical protein
MFVADNIKTLFDVYFAEDLAQALNEALMRPAPLHWLASLWRLDEIPSNPSDHVPATPEDAE